MIRVDGEAAVKAQRDAASKETNESFIVRGLEHNLECSRTVDFYSVLVRVLNVFDNPITVLKLCLSIVMLMR